MPMGIVSDTEFDKELTNVKSDNGREKSNSVPMNPTTIQGTIIDVPRGRPVGSVEVPNGIRKLIGEESAINGRQSALELAQSLGISPSSVSAYNAGATSTATYDDTPNKPHIDAAKLRVSKRARARLMSALHHITDEKLSNSKARELAGIAKDMSAVIRNMEEETNPNNGNGQNNGPTFIFYSPQFRKEEHFDVVNAKE